MRMHRLCAATAAAAFLLTLPAHAADDTDLSALKQEIKALSESYEKRLRALEQKLEAAEGAAKQKAASTAPARETRTVRDNSFNPAIGVILNGTAASFSNDTSEVAGFALGEEGERGPEGLAINETELNFSANVDDKFYGAVTAAIANEDGGSVLELEEAYLETLPDLGLPDGLRLKAGRALWTLGYLNEHHRHTDDFADRPLPYRVYLNSAYNDDGLQASWVLPTNIFAEVGGGLYRGDDFPYGSANGDDIVGAWSLFGRVGGDIGANQAWQFGASLLVGETDGRAAAEDTVTFIGDTALYVADLRYVWAPTGNERDQEVILQGEFFYRDEDGTYEDTNAGTGAVDFDDGSHGWYAQAVYKFLPQWRAGLRYSRMGSADTPAGLAGSALDAGGYDPHAIALMVDWTNTEFSRIRLQFNHEELADGEIDNQLWLQYTMSIGAHGAHPF